jgi:mobilization protein NikA
MTATAILKTRVTPHLKARVAAVARSEMLSEALWLRRLVSRGIQEHAESGSHSGQGSSALPEPCSTNRGKTARLYVRLRREDQLLLHERATARGMASATYVSVLIRSHLRGLIPLPKDELLAFKRAVGELSAIGRNLNQITRAANQGGRITGPGRDEFKAILKVCEALRDHTKDLIKCNTASWASGYAEDTI